jgi:hypothetical protein
MPPMPKTRATRQRRNHTSTRTTLHLVPGTVVPVLPARANGELWHERALELWRKAWQSPMSGEYIELDIEALLLVVDLTHNYWSNPSTPLAAEIRLQRMSLGLTPLDRRRLEWEVERVEQIKTARPVTARSRRDPRAILGAAAT